MKAASKFISIIVLALAFGAWPGVASAEPLTVASDFEGASVAGVGIDEAARSISFMPGGDPARGWPCWWYFRVNG
ncbi:MAG: zinc carboxypeptidase, partial [Chthoniobacteraceae bacterium]